MPVATTPQRSDGEFWKVADSKLIRYGGSWSKVRVKSAKGAVMYVSILQHVTSSANTVFRTRTAGASSTGRVDR